MSASILVVEDYDPDYEAAARGFRRIGVTYPLVRCRDGEEALTFVQTEKPALVFLDLNLPGIDGLEVLRTMKSDPDLKTVPVVVWSSNGREEKIAEAYAIGANSYLNKRMSPADLFEDLKVIVHYWLRTVRLPGLAA